MKNKLFRSLLKSGLILFLLSLFLLPMQNISAGTIAVDASDLTPEVIKKYSDLKVTGVLTTDVIEAFKHSGTGLYTTDPNFNVQSVDFSEAEVIDSLAMDSVFMNYIGLRSVVFPVRGVEYIRSLEFAFFTTALVEGDLSACHGLVSLRQAFDGCKKLVKVDISGCERIENLFLAFSNAPNLAQIEMPSKAPELRYMFHMLISNRSLTEIKLPATVHPDCKSGYSFVDCSMLEKVTLPSNLAMMQEATLFSCPKLRSILYEGEQMLEWNEWAFLSNRAESNTQPGEITLYVNKEKVVDYQISAGWKIIKAILPIEASGMEQYKQVASTIIYHNGQICTEGREAIEVCLYTIQGCLLSTVRIENGVASLNFLPKGSYIALVKEDSKIASLKFNNR